MLPYKTVARARRKGVRVAGDSVRSKVNISLEGSVWEQQLCLHSGKGCHGGLIALVDCLVITPSYCILTSSYRGVRI